MELVMAQEVGEVDQPLVLVIVAMEEMVRPE